MSAAVANTAVGESEVPSERLETQIRSSAASAGQVHEGGFTVGFAESVGVLCRAFDDRMTADGITTNYGGPEFDIVIRINDFSLYRS